MSDLYYEKDNKVYLSGPLADLNSDPLRAGKHRGDKLQAFFNENGIDFDLGSGTGSAKYNIYMLCRDSQKNIVGCAPVFLGTDYQREHCWVHGNRNMRACENFTDKLKSNVFTSEIYVFKGAEKYPRILYTDTDGGAHFTEPIDRIRVEDYKPTKPNWFKTLMHAINKNWYGKDFDKYDAGMRDYRKFTGNFATVKEKVEAELANHIKLANQKANEQKHIEYVDDLEKTIAHQNRLIDSFLGPEQKDDERLLKNRTYKLASFPKIPIELPEEMPFTKHEFAIVAYALLADLDIAAIPEKNEFLDSKENASNNYCGLTHDVFFYRDGRPNSDKFFQAYNPARNKALELIKNYMNGDKEGLAKAIGTSIKQQFEAVNQLGGTNEQSAAIGDTICQMLGILSKDPELVAQCGLTKDDMITAKARVTERDLFEKQLESEQKIIEAQAHDLKLPKEVKENLLADVFLARMFKTELAKSVEDRQAGPECQQKSIELATAQMEMNKISEKLIKEQAKPKEQRNPQIEIDLTRARKKGDACMTKFLIESGKGEITPLMKLFGTDDSNKTNQKAFIEKMKQTELFKQFADKEIYEISDLLTSDATLSNTLDATSMDIMKQIVKNEKVPDVKEYKKELQLKVENVVNAIDDEELEKHAEPEKQI